MKVNKLPTGYLFTDHYSKGELETLSIGDYGKEHNVKADFLGYTKEIHGVPNMETKPLSEKWVMTLSTQYGCPMKCTFCDVPKIHFRGNASEADLVSQFGNARKCFPNVKYVERLNIHFARMGEGTFNFDNIFSFCKFLQINKDVNQKLYDLRIEVIHPVLTTMLPKRLYLSKLNDILQEWCKLKNDLYHGQAGLQLSINSTNDEQRNEMFADESHSLEKIASLCESLPEPVSRKYCLNFAFASNYEVEGIKLAKLFDPAKFMCKITPIHLNMACKENKIETLNGYSSYAPYREAESSLKNAGFDVLVFIPSLDEEKGLVTCGNVILSGSQITC